MHVQLVLSNVRISKRECLPALPLDDPRHPSSKELLRRIIAYVHSKLDPALRANTLLRVTVKTAVFKRCGAPVYDVFDCDFGFDSQVELPS